MLSKLKFKRFNAESKPGVGGEVLLFLHDRWRGYDEIVTATFDGDIFYVNRIAIRPSFIAGWLELPIKLAYDSNPELIS